MYKNVNIISQSIIFKLQRKFEIEDQMNDIGFSESVILA